MRSSFSQYSRTFATPFCSYSPPSPAYQVALFAFFPSKAAALAAEAILLDNKGAFCCFTKTNQKLPKQMALKTMAQGLDAGRDVPELLDVPEQRRFC